MKEECPYYHPTPFVVSPNAKALRSNVEFQYHPYTSRRRRHFQYRHLDVELVCLPQYLGPW